MIQTLLQLSLATNVENFLWAMQLDLCVNIAAKLAIFFNMWTLEIKINTKIRQLSRLSFSNNILYLLFALLMEESLFMKETLRVNFNFWGILEILIINLLLLKLLPGIVLLPLAVRMGLLIFGIFKNLPSKEW